MSEPRHLCASSSAAVGSICASIASAARRIRPPASRSPNAPDPVESIDACPACACNASSDIPSSPQPRPACAEACDTSTVQARHDPGRVDHPIKPRADSDSPRRGPFNTTKHASVSTSGAVGLEIPAERLEEASRDLHDPLAATLLRSDEQPLPPRSHPKVQSGTSQRRSPTSSIASKSAVPLRPQRASNLSTSTGASTAATSAATDHPHPPASADQHGAGKNAAPDCDPRQHRHGRRYSNKPVMLDMRRAMVRADSPALPSSIRTTFSRRGGRRSAMNANTSAQPTSHGSLPTTSKNIFRS